MFILEYIYRNKGDEWEKIGEFETKEKMWSNIDTFFKEHNYTPPYFRQWNDEDGRVFIDFGSHTLFYRYTEM